MVESSNTFDNCLTISKLRNFFTTEVLTKQLMSGLSDETKIKPYNQQLINYIIQKFEDYQQFFDMQLDEENQPNKKGQIVTKIFISGKIALNLNKFNLCYNVNCDKNGIIQKVQIGVTNSLFNQKVFYGFNLKYWTLKSYKIEIGTFETPMDIIETKQNAYLSISNQPSKASNQPPTLIGSSLTLVMNAVQNKQEVKFIERTEIIRYQENLNQLLKANKYTVTCEEITKKFSIKASCERETANDEKLQTWPQKCESVKESMIHFGDSVNVCDMLTLKKSFFAQELVVKKKDGTVLDLYKYPQPEPNFW